MCTLVAIHTAQIDSGSKTCGVKAGEIFVRKFRERHSRTISAEGDFSDVKRNASSIGIGFGSRLGKGGSLCASCNDRPKAQAEPNKKLPHSDSPIKLDSCATDAEMTGGRHSATEYRPIAPT